MRRSTSHLLESFQDCGTRTRNQQSSDRSVLQSEPRGNCKRLAVAAKLDGGQQNLLLHAMCLSSPRRKYPCPESVKKIVLGSAVPLHSIA